MLVIVLAFGLVIIILRKQTEFSESSINGNQNNLLVEMVDEISTDIVVPPKSATATTSEFLLLPTRAVEIVEIATSEIPTTVPTPLAFVDGPIVIGNTVKNRPINIYRFGTGERAYLIIGGIHGGYELNTVSLTTELIEYFIKNSNLIPVDARLYILNALNVDGLLHPYQFDGRANANGVDLNRNYPVYWEPTWPRDGCWDYGPINSGSRPASEPETIAVMAFMLENPITAVVSYHAAAPGFYVAGEPSDLASIDLANYLSKASGYPYPAIDVGCQMTGSLVDWGLTAGAAGVDLELSDHRNSEFDRNLALVLALLKWVP
jgi:murein peptide amidase A